MDGALCDELIQEIFHRLPPPSSSAVSLVSKRWLNLHRSSISHLSLNLSPTPNLSLSSFLSCFPFLTSLSLSLSSSSSSLSLLPAAATCPNLRHLRILSAPVSVFYLLSLSSCCPLLVSLSVSLSPPFSLHFLSLFRSLKELSLNFAFASDQNPDFDFPQFDTQNPDFNFTQFDTQSPDFNFPQFDTQNPDFNFPKFDTQNPDFNFPQLDSSTQNPDFNSGQFDSSTQNPDFNSAQFDLSAQNPDFNSAQFDLSTQNSDFNSAQFDLSTQNPDFNSAQFDSSYESPNFNPALFNSSTESPNFNPAQFNSSAETSNFNPAQFNSSVKNPNFNLSLKNKNSSSAQFNSRLKGSSFDVELQLETLTLSCIRNDNYSLNWLYRSCKKLKRLKFRACEGVGDNPSSSSFLNCIKNVQEVELRTCRMIIDVVLLKLAENSKLLKTLLVYDGGCREGLLRFIERSECDLQKLDLRLPLDLDNRHLSAVAEKFRGLTSLRLQSCCLVTGEGLKAICLSKKNGLEELALMNCDVAEREPGLLTTLAQCLKGLKKLDLSYNEMLVDKEFVSMIVSCGDLKELKLRGCRGLSSLALVSISKYCKNLECVDIMYCCGIEAKDVELFVSNAPRLWQLIVEENKLSDKVKTRV